MVPMSQNMAVASKTDQPPSKTTTLENHSDPSGPMAPLPPAALQQPNNAIERAPKANGNANFGGAGGTGTRQEQHQRSFRVS